jgi:hypothetical protein
MNIFRDKFDSPRWVEKRNIVLERADYVCEGCGANSDLQVHICYWIKDLEPWDLPDDAYKCYCIDCRSERKTLESDIRVLFAAFSLCELEAWHRAINELAGIRSASRGPSVERMYVAAKNVRNDREAQEWRSGMEESDEES